MRLILSAVVVFSMLPCATAVDADQPRKDQENTTVIRVGLDGAWEGVDLVVAGTQASEAERKGIKMTFTGQRMVLKRPCRIDTLRYSILLDPSKRPMAINVTALDGNFKDVTLPGIYELTGDELKLCIPNQETKERPTAFKSAEGSHLYLFVLKRSKP